MLNKIRSNSISAHKTRQIVASQELKQQLMRVAVDRMEVIKR